MRASTRWLAPGLAKRSLKEFKRFAKIALTSEAVRAPMTPYLLLDFSDPETLPDCKTMSDADIGGYSSACLEQVEKMFSQPAHARFHGSISTDLPRNRPQVQRTGYAGWRNKDRPATIFGKSLWDLDPYTYLAMRVKSDGRKYFVNVQTESIVHTDLHQHRLQAQKSGEWETILIELNAFVRTNYGEVVEPQTEMMRQKIRTIGVSLIDRVPGPFELAISRVWASNKVENEVLTADEDAQTARDVEGHVGRLH